MALGTFITNAGTIVLCNALVDRYDAGAGAGTVKIYAGTKPADADTALSGETLLGTLTLSDPAFGNAADDTPGAIATASAITDDSSADATGTAAYFRGEDSNSLTVTDGTVGTSGADMNLNTIAIVAGAVLSLSAYTFFVPEG